MFNRIIALFIFFYCLPQISVAQVTDTVNRSAGLPVSAPGNTLLSADMGADSSITTYLSLKQCIAYAIKHQPALNQSYINEKIARTNNAIAFSGWMPQVNGAANYQYYFELPTSFSPGYSIVNNQLVPNGTLNPVQTGVHYLSTPGVAATQTIFSIDVLLAARAAKLNNLQAKQNTEAVKIELVSEVSKAFYDLLNSIQQIRVYKEDTARLNKNLSDTYHQYKSGIVDKVDYKRAAISLNNSLAQLKMAVEAVQAKYAYLQQVMGYPNDQRFNVSFDTTSMMQEVYYDTTEPLNFEKRIEYQQLLITRRLQKETTAYYQLGFLPSLSAFYNYNQEYESNSFSKLYSGAYPNSFWGLQLNVPLFTGFKRLENIHKAKLQERSIDWDEVNLKLLIYTQYKQAYAGYRSNLYNLQTAEDNIGMARDVYNIVKLQYKEGIKAYLEVIVAESDLQSSEINYLNALFALLSSKIDLERAMGDINTGQ